jgi:EAL domain-containing protein (putative c-di-GMP-specific phosphodiesterase class I)
VPGQGEPPHAGHDAEAPRPDAPAAVSPPLDEEVLRRARATLASLVTEDSALPSLNAIADAIRLEFDAHEKVAILYVKLRRYGRLEHIFGWQIVNDILTAVAQNLRGMVGSSLRRLDVIADFTLSDNAFVVILSPPRSRDVIAGDDLAAINRRVYERLQATLLNDLAPGVYDRVHPSVGAAVVAADDDLTFEQNLHRGVALAMQAADVQAAAYDAQLDQTLLDCLSRNDLEAVFEPIIDMARHVLVGYHATVRGPFYSPLRLPDVLNDVARRSRHLAAFGIQARETEVAAAEGLQPDELLMMDCAAAEQPNAAVLALSEFYSLNKALVPQRVVFAIEAGDLSVNTASTLRTLANIREMGFQLCVTRLGSEFTALERVAAASPEMLALDPALIAHADSDPTLIDVVQLLVRFADRTGAQLLAPGVTRDEQLKALHRVGVELFTGEFIARADTRLPRVTPAKLGL